jgi:hypothetical protein
MLATLNQAKQHLFSEEKKEEQPEAPQEAVAEEKKPDEPGRQDA